MPLVCYDQCYCWSSRNWNFELLLVMFVHFVQKNQYPHYLEKSFETMFNKKKKFNQIWSKLYLFYIWLHCPYHPISTLQLLCFVPDVLLSWSDCMLMVDGRLLRSTKSVILWLLWLASLSSSSENMSGSLSGIGLPLKGMLGSSSSELDKSSITSRCWVTFPIMRRNFSVKRKLETFTRVFDYKWLDEKVKNFLFLNQKFLIPCTI